MCSFGFFLEEALKGKGATGLGSCAGREQSQGQVSQGVPGPHVSLSWHWTSFSVALRNRLAGLASALSLGPALFFFHILEMGGWGSLLQLNSKPKTPRKKKRGWGRGRKESKPIISSKDKHPIFFLTQNKHASHKELKAEEGRMCLDLGLL